MYATIAKPNLDNNDSGGRFEELNLYAKLKSCLKTRLLTKVVYSLGELLDARV